ncbi:hypothetical protein GOP47_0008627 [Adiantum capillus-veneris]|uniref:Cytochrome P450 n=1 Tax=Adiantum capillus-veneris TaxID=13818 RepID=A0A9D4UZH2_ADICA|nr:hypothetical protein GOP47_0008627 [Adiantum capillus-veneris]
MYGGSCGAAGGFTRNSFALCRAYTAVQIASQLADPPQACSEPMPSMSHAAAHRLQPHLHLWSKTYGDYFVFWFGFQARYVLKDPEQAKELLTIKSEHFGKTTRRPDANDLIGNGLLVLNGEKWAQHRHIVNSAFFVEKLKAMALVMVDLTNVMMKNWESCIKRNESIDVAREFKILTADIIAHTAFGSSFAEGKLVFEMQDKQQLLFSKLMSAPYIPGYRFLPTPKNRYRNNLKTRIHEVLGQIIQKREALIEAVRGDHDVLGSMYGNDLLGLMLAANRGELQGNQRSFTMGLDELIDECKTFFFAGHETTATLLTFMFLLLAAHQEWQECLREEVFEACGKTQLPTVESLNQLKLVGMVINETLRLYPPATAIYREADTDMSLGETLVPAGTVNVHSMSGFLTVEAMSCHYSRLCMPCRASSLKRPQTHQYQVL